MDTMTYEEIKARYDSQWSHPQRQWTVAGRRYSCLVAC